MSNLAVEEGKLLSGADPKAVSSLPEPVASILLVDDHAELLLAMEAVLAPLGHRIVTATSGEEALRRVLHEDFALIILDVHMPGMDGFETAAMIRSRERSRDVPIIFLTGILKSDLHASRGFSLGAADYLFKPVHADVLQSKVTVFVDLYKKTEQVKRQAEQMRILQQQEHERILAASHLQQIQRELEFAKEIQTSILPSTLDLEGVNIYANLQPAREVGGDFYDLIPHFRRDPMLTCVIGDVMGKGMPAALMAVMALTVIREMSRITSSPRELFRQTNVRLYEQLHNVEITNAVSAAAFTLNLRKKTMRYCKAGHENLLWWHVRDRSVETVSAEGVFLGLFPEQLFEEVTLRVETGDKLLLFTDGVTEARNPQGGLFGITRVEQILESHGGRDVTGLGDTVQAELLKFRDSAPIADDIAYMIVEVA